MSAILLVLCLISLFIEQCQSQGTATLTSDSSSLIGSLCPQVVTMTCSVENIPLLIWSTSSFNTNAYVYSPEDESRVPIDIVSSPPLPTGVMIIVVNVTQSTVDPDRFTAVSILNTTLSVLEGLNVQSVYCGSNEVQSEILPVDFTILGSPPPNSSAICSLVTSANGSNVSLQWSSSFNSQHAVERYRVSVDPDPSSSCSSDQVIPSEDYSCPGLSTEWNYSITVSAVNCVDQEGESDTFTVLPQLLAPQQPQGVEINSSQYDATGNITVNWMESDSISGACLFSGSINYILILEDSAGEVVEERVVSSDSSCNNGNCSSSFSPSSQICRVSIIARNTFGGSSRAIANVFPGKLSRNNLVLLILGVVFSCGAIGIFIIIITVLGIIKLRKGGYGISSALILVPVMVVVIMVVLIVVLWLAVGFQVGLQDNTCESVWQSTRNNLIISAFAFSLVVLSFLLTVFIVIILCVKKSRRKASMEMEDISWSSCGSYGDPPTATWFPKETQWPRDKLSENKKLRVYFMMRNCKSWNWKYNNKIISYKVIMQIVKESWSGCFVANKNKHQCQIRVTFKDGPFGSWSAIGSKAEGILLPKPTMVFNFNNMSDEEIKATVIHQFGHALGLGHALMKFDDWSNLKPNVDVDSMMRSCGASNEGDFEVLWTGKTLSRADVSQDEKSVMIHSFNHSWYKPELSEDFKTSELYERQKSLITDLSTEDKKMLKYILKPPPKYILDPGCVEAVAGTSPTINFTVESRDPMPANIKHKITKCESEACSLTWNIEGNCITFPHVKVCDSGTYTISCHNTKRVEGEETFKLNIRPGTQPEYNILEFSNPLKAVIGESPTITFKVKCEPPLSRDHPHTLTKSDGESVRFKVVESRINFHDVQVDDSGAYTICCDSPNGLSGKTTFNLEVSQSRARNLSHSFVSGFSKAQEKLSKVKDYVKNTKKN